ncbi:G patch domain-containing protein 1-like [Clytia hemisphaerica]|uniref:G-patch domain-containing protein n=1 Tax=Clytia hemisphaerica TaxID=252671 RepID=A0A7M5V014_9CNID
MFDDDENDDYVTIGTPFEIPDDIENAPLKKQAKVSDQIVTDKQGRRRFHGAFTGGFSAGYFNTVGSKEGWTPSTFKSSRKSKNQEIDEDEGSGQNQRFQQRPEDFMDDEDFSEHGIAPRRLKTTSDFTSTEEELNSRKRQITQHLNENEEQPASDSLLDELLLPTKLSIGIQILKKMGWKQGQGVGEKDRAASVPEPVKGKKVYGCMRPQATDSTDMSAFKKLLAPKDVVQISFTRKDNFHGIGYSGLDPTTAMFGSGLESRSFKPTGKEKRGIKGHAFGVGAFEDEDKDIYGVDNMSNYDISMTVEDESHKHGWSGAPKLKQNKGCLSGFEKGSRVLKAPSTQKMISIPSGFIPKHTFPSNEKNSSITCTQNDGDKNNKARLTSKERGLMFGETVKTLDDVNKWALKWDDRPAQEENDSEKDRDMETEKQEKSNRFSSRWDKEINQVRPKIINKPSPADTAEETKPKKDVPMYDVKSKTFRPFAKNPEKQARYEEFVKAKKENRDAVFQYDTSVTEWERQRERDEFTRASILYRPLNSMFANRFTPATSADPQNITLKSTMVEKPNDGSGGVPTKESNTSSSENDDRLSDDMKAAKMGMYGKLTRSVHQWHPDQLLCKRFNIPEPYPGSKIRGVPDRARKSKAGSFFERDFLSIAMSSSNENDNVEDIEEDDFASRIKNDEQKTLQKKTLKIGPLAHLNRNLGEVDNESNGAESITESNQGTSSSVSITKSITSKPSIDIFKAIFDDSESSSSDESDSDETQKEIDKSPPKIDKPDEETRIVESNKTNQSQMNDSIGSAYKPKTEGPLAF